MNPELFMRKALAEKKIQNLLAEVKKLRDEIESINKEMSHEYARDYYINKTQERRG